MLLGSAFAMAESLIQHRLGMTTPAFQIQGRGCTYIGAALVWTDYLVRDAYGSRD